MTDPAELQDILDAIHLAQDCLGKHYAREMKDGSRPIWTALDWCDAWFSATLDELSPSIPPQSK